MGTAWVALGRDAVPFALLFAVAFLAVAAPSVQIGVRLVVGMALWAACPLAAEASTFTSAHILRVLHGLEV